MCNSVATKSRKVGAKGVKIVRINRGMMNVAWRQIETKEVF